MSQEVKTSPFEIKFRLMKYKLSNMWLLTLLHRKGCKFDKSVLSNVLNGAIVSGSRYESIITYSKEILDNYEKWLNAQ